MTHFSDMQGRQRDLFSNSSGEMLAEIGRYGGGVPPRFLGEDGLAKVEAERDRLPDRLFGFDRER